MRDLIFFGAAAVLSGVMISVAMAHDPRTQASTPFSVGKGQRDFVKVTGMDLNRFRQARRDTVTFIRKNEQASYIRLTSRRNTDLPTVAKDVAYLPISTDLQVAFAQKDLKVIVSARSAPENGSPAMRLQFSAGSEGHSEWHSYLLTPEWDEYVFHYTPPASSGDLGLDFFAIWADPDGLGRGVEVRTITFDTRPASTPQMK